jgi:hypothetical protein
MKELDYKIAMRAHEGTSFSPEKRGRSEVECYNAHLADVKEMFNKVANTESQKALAIDLFNTYADKYHTLKVDYLCSRSRCMSTMITGPANFPVRSQEKKNRSSDNKFQKMIDWCDYAQSKYKNLILKERFQDFSELEESKQILSNMEKLQTGMKKANSLLKKLSKQSATIEQFNKLFEIESDISVTFMIETARWNTPPHKGYESFRLTNNNSLVKRLKAKVLKLEATENATEEDNKENSFEGFTVVENKADDRIQFLFEGKPEEKIRNILKSRAFRWSPKNNAWQRKLTNNAIYAGQCITKEIQELA